MCRARPIRELGHYWAVILLKVAYYFTMMTRQTENMHLSSKTTPPVPSSWNSPTSAMSDVEKLSYRSPTAVPILPADLRSIEQSTTLSYPPSQQAKPSMDPFDALCNRSSMGRGRGALLLNRGSVHRERVVLHNQLRIAHGIGYNNEAVESMFQNSDESAIQTPDTVTVEVQAQLVDINKDDDPVIPHVDKRKNSLETTSEEDERRDDSEEESDLHAPPGEWKCTFVTRTKDPAIVHRKNVALASLLRRNKSLKDKEVDIPRTSNEVKQAPVLTPVAKKEDWRAEIKAIEEANRETNKKAGWRSAGQEPLLGNIKIQPNWSMFAPDVATKPVEDSASRCSYAYAKGTAEATVGVPPKSDRSEDSDLFFAPQRERKNKSKKNRNLPLMWNPERLQRKPSAAPPGYFMPTNGVPPMAIRNPEYNTGRSSHNTFSNMFERSMKDQQKNKYKRDAFFGKGGDDFPQLK